MVRDEGASDDFQDRERGAASSDGLIGPIADVDECGNEWNFLTNDTSATTRFIERVTCTVAHRSICKSIRTD